MTEKEKALKWQKAFRYTEKVVFNVGLSVLFLVERSIIEQARIRFENKGYVFYLWEMLLEHVFTMGLAWIQTCLGQGTDVQAALHAASAQGML